MDAVTRRLMPHVMRRMAANPVVLITLSVDARGDGSYDTYEQRTVENAVVADMTQTDIKRENSGGVSTAIAAVITLPREVTKTPDAIEYRGLRYRVTSHAVKNGVSIFQVAPWIVDVI